jgi:hypothetical protein
MASYNVDKSVATFSNITLTVWSAGIQIQKKGSANVTFISKGSIGSLHLIKEVNGSFIRYTPINFQNVGPYEVASWWTEKVSNDYAVLAYEFIMDKLYDRPNEDRDSKAMANSQLYI